MFDVPMLIASGQSALSAAAVLRSNALSESGDQLDKDGRPWIGASYSVKVRCEQQHSSPA